MFKTINGGKLPTRGSKYSACVDLYANADVTIGAGETVLIPLGVCIDFKMLDTIIIDRELLNLVGVENIGHPSVEEDAFKEMWLSSHYLQLMLRSSLSKELIIANGVGVIDMDYKDEIMIRVYNSYNPSTFYKSNISGEVSIKKGDRVAQITLLEHKSYLFSIDTEDERTGGFGSTDKKDK